MLMGQEMILDFKPMNKAGDMKGGEDICTAGSPEIVPEMIEDLKDAFNLVDIDRGGDIDVTELKIAARSFGLEPTVEELEQMLNAMDEDGGGTIDLEEFTEAVAEELRRLCAREKVEEAFGFFDREGGSRRSQDCAALVCTPSQGECARGLEAFGGPLVPALAQRLGELSRDLRAGRRWHCPRGPRGAAGPCS